MEIIAEVIGTVLWWILQFLGEVALQIAFEFLGELLGHSVREVFRKPEPTQPWLAVVGYVVFGAVAGGISLVIFPQLLIEGHWTRIANLALTPIVAGLSMAALGAWRRRREREVIRLDSFAYGYLFALTMAAVRFSWGQ